MKPWGMMRRLGVLATGGAAPPAPFMYLDDLAVLPTAAMSLHKLISTATVAVRVRRSSDNAEQDIGFDGDALDTTSLASFVGANSAYVTTWYDQTGNGKNAVQATSSKQPRIVAAGAYDGALIWDGTDDAMMIASMTQGSPQFAVYGNIKRATGLGGAEVLLEGSTNYNSNGQNFLLFNTNSSGDQWSANACNAAGFQRQNLFPAATAALNTCSFLWDRALTGAGEIAMRESGIVLSPTPNITVEQTGTFTSYDVYIGARAGTSLFADMHSETLVFYNADTSAIMTNIEDIVAIDRDLWFTRFNAPTSFTKIGSTYFMADCWHHRILYSDNIATPAGQWKVLDDLRPTGPHAVTSDGHLFVADSADDSKIESYKSDGSGGYVHVQTLTFGAGTRPHRVHYDSGTTAFYAILGGAPGLGGTRQIVKMTRSGDTLSIDHTTNLGFMSGGYCRSFNIIAGKMYFVAETAKVYEVSFDGTSGGYTLDATYDLPTGFESPNDVYRDSSGDWWVTATENAILKSASLAAIDAGTYTDMYATLGLGGTPYYLSEFDGALWIPEIIDRNGLTKVVGGTPTVIHNYGTESASSLYRHNNPPLF